ncbi:hypothetical protein KUCAC02_005155, partial [Chaenocephalus aceratus]
MGENQPESKSKSMTEKSKDLAPSLRPSLYTTLLRTDIPQLNLALPAGLSHGSKTLPVVEPEKSPGDSLTLCFRAPQSPSQILYDGPSNSSAIILTVLSFYYNTVFRVTKTNNVYRGREIPFIVETTQPCGLQRSYFEQYGTGYRSFLLTSQTCFYVSETSNMELKSRDELSEAALFEETGKAIARRGITLKRRGAPPGSAESRESRLTDVSAAEQQVV